MFAPVLTAYGSCRFDQLKVSEKNNPAFSSFSSLPAYHLTIFNGNGKENEVVFPDHFLSSFRHPLVSSQWVL